MEYFLHYTPKMLGRLICTGDYYRFAHIYKYYLGLKGGMAPNNNSHSLRN